MVDSQWEATGEGMVVYEENKNQRALFLKVTIMRVLPIGSRENTQVHGDRSDMINTPTRFNGHLSES